MSLKPRPSVTFTSVRGEPVHESVHAVSQEEPPVAKGSPPAVTNPFHHVDPTLYPEPLAHVPVDVRRSRLTKAHSSRPALEHPSQGSGMLDAQEQGPLSRLTPKTRRMSQGDVLRRKVSNGGLFPDISWPSLPTRLSHGSACTSTSKGARSPLSRRSSYTSAYEEALNQGYALPSCQGLSRRSWLGNETASVADRIAIQAQKSFEKGPSGKQDVPMKGKPPESSTGIGMSPAPAKVIKGIVGRIFG